MIKTKIFVLVASLVTFGLYLIGKHAVDLGLCGENDYGCRANYDSFESAMYFAKAFVFVAVSSLFLKQTQYLAWLKFAIVALPIAIFLLVVINLGVFHSQTAGSFGEGDIYNMVFDQIYTFVVYSFFIAGSSIVLFLVWRKSKKLGVKAK